MLGSFIRSSLVFLALSPLPANPADLPADSGPRSVRLSALGDRMYREARFEDAEAAYSQALRLDERNLQAQLGMGRIATLLSQPQRAQNYYSAAYQIAPRDPNTILAFAGVVENARARQTLLRNFLDLAPATPGDFRKEDIKARLQIAERLGATPVAELSSPYQAYRLPLLDIQRKALLLKARINGRDVSLILDTGATGIVLNASTGSHIDLEVLADAAIRGFGAAAPVEAQVARAASFEAGGLKIANVLLNVGHVDLAPQADGFIGLDIFHDFLIRLNAPARMLELTPYTENACGECSRVLRIGHLLLMRGTINGAAEGYFVLDSGSSRTVVSRRLVAEGGRAAVLNGAQGPIDLAVPSGPIVIRLAGQRLMDFEYAAFDAAGISSQNGTEIAGAIGYSLLRDLVTTVDYRNGLVQLSIPARE